MRPKCRFLEPLQAGKGKRRDCGHPRRGGTAELLVECQSCEMWDGLDGTPPAPPPPVTRTPLPCLHEGAPAPPPNGLPSTKAYLTCDAGRGVVCRCACNAKCPGYEPEGGT